MSKKKRPYPLTIAASIYHSGIPGGIPNNGIPSIGKDSKDKVSIDQDSKGEFEGKIRPGLTDEQKALFRRAVEIGRSYVKK